MAFSPAIIPQNGPNRAAAERDSHSDGGGRASGPASAAAAMNAGTCLPSADLEGISNA